MFAAHCPTCAATVLLDESRITGLRSAGQCHAVRYRCWCGTSGTWRPRRPEGPTP